MLNISPLPRRLTTRRSPRIMLAVVATLLWATAASAAKPPLPSSEALQKAVDGAHAKFKDVKEGANANYIPILDTVPSDLFGVVIATLLLIAAPMFLLAHSGRPLRAWHLFVYLNATSPISWGSFLLSIYPINCVIYGYFMFKGNARLTKIFGLIGIPLALMVHGYTGFILSFAKAHVLWRTSMMSFAVTRSM